MIRLVLPWPPSVNRMWRTVRLGASQRTLLSADGRRYRDAVNVALRGSQAPARGCKLAVLIHACPPDRRRRDLDNMLKGPLDAIQHAGVIEDDSLIDDLHIIRQEPVKGGRLVVEITEIAS